MPDSNDLPINRDFFTLLDSRTYIRTKKRIVALCVLESKFGTQLKLYEWNFKGPDGGWKVGLANLSVRDIDLTRVALDAQQLAKEYAIAINWNSSKP
jgi:hypothetical protein